LLNPLICKSLLPQLAQLLERFLGIEIPLPLVVAFHVSVLVDSLLNPLAFTALITITDFIAWLHHAQAEYASDKRLVSHLLPVNSK
jgi:hypothetical protein